MFRVIRGKSALSLFRLEKLRVLVSTAIPDIQVAGACHWYFLSLNKNLSVNEAKLLDTLLGLEESDKDRGGGGRMQQMLVVPRLGTISPWSSKATAFSLT